MTRLVTATFTDPTDLDGDDPRADLRWGTIGAAARDAVARGGDREAIVDGDRRWSWVDVGDAVDRAARAYFGAGIEVGDRVAIWAPNCAEWVLVQYATALISSFIPDCWTT